jgi:hypothetical protein
VDLDLAVDLNDDATEDAIRLDHAYLEPRFTGRWPIVAAEGATDAEQDVPVIVQVHDDVQVHLQNGFCTQVFDDRPCAINKPGPSRALMWRLEIATKRSTRLSTHHI